MRLDQPLSDAEFDELDDFLLSERCAEDSMTMDTLHGYLTALAIGPLEAPMSTWLPQVWSESGDAPEFRSEKEASRITGLIARYMNEILITFEVAPKEYEPLFCEMEHEGKPLLDAEPWVRGFWEGMQLLRGHWDPLFQSDVADLMRPFYLLGSDELEEEEQVLVDTPEKRHRLAIEVEANIPAIQRFWKPLRKSSITPAERTAPKTGRNDPCPCGSDKKFKQCCANKSPDA